MNHHQRLLQTQIRSKQRVYKSFTRCRRGHDFQLHVQSVPVTTKVVSSNPA